MYMYNWMFFIQCFVSGFAVGGAKTSLDFRLYLWVCMVFAVLRWSYIGEHRSLFESKASYTCSQAHSNLISFYENTWNSQHQIRIGLLHKQTSTTTTTTATNFHRTGGTTQVVLRLLLLLSIRQSNCRVWGPIRAKLQMRQKFQIFNSKTIFAPASPASIFFLFAVFSFFFYDPFCCFCLLFFLFLFFATE